jgi:hypothetical protein
MRLNIRTEIIRIAGRQLPYKRRPHRIANVTGHKAPATLRSRITNHSDLLPGLDGRTAAARRFRDLVCAYIADMGGIDHCSEIKLGLLRRLAATTVQSEIIEAKMVNGEQVDISTLCTLASTTVRIAQRLGIERHARDVTPPNVAEYVAYLQSEAGT